MDDAEETGTTAVPRFTALILAGHRQGGDAWSARKVLLPVGGTAMYLHVVRALAATPLARQLLICGLDESELAAQPDLAGLLETGRLRIVSGRESPSASVLHVMETVPDCTPLLVTTADHPLLAPEIVEYFWKKVPLDGCDLAVGLVPAENVRSAFPHASRTWLRFGRQAYCSSNLFALPTPRSRVVPEAWIRIERMRKRPWRMVGHLGPVPLLRFLLGRLTLYEAMDLASRRLGIEATTVFLHQPEAAIDVDTPEDLTLVSAILERRAQEIARPPSQPTP